MLVAYVPLLMMFILMAILAIVMIVMSHILSPGTHKAQDKFESPYECGLPSEGVKPGRYPIKFYLVAILFVVFDVEAVFLWPWAVSFQSFRASGNVVFWYAEMVVFIGILLVGYLYLIGKGAFDWK